MYLYEMIEALEALPADAMVGLTEPHSYRGYYQDLAFEECEPRPVSDVIKMAKNCLGRTYEGYKGGDYTMGGYTDVWIANWGDCGRSLTSDYFENIILKMKIAELEGK